MNGTALPIHDTDMLQFNRDQWKALSKHRELDFQGRAVAYLRERYPAWCAKREHSALLRHVAAAAKFSAANQVHLEGNILRLLDAAMLPGFSANPTGYPFYRLTQPGFDETTRVTNFAAALLDKQGPVVISLETDLTSLRREHA